jgi:hypothetical protein
VNAWLEITQPEPGAVVDSSPMLIVGTVRPVNSYPVIFELVTERGGAIVSKQLAVEIPGKALDFEISLGYPPVTEVRDMRLIVRQSAGFAGGVVILDSLPITLTP